MLAPPKAKEVAPKAKTPAPVPAPKAKTSVPAGSVMDTAPIIGNSKMEIIGESTADKDAVGPSKTIVVQCAKRTLASCLVPAPKCPRLDLEVQLEESQIEAAQLRIWNTELEKEAANWCQAVVDLRAHSRVQEAEVLSMSNQLYSMGCDWGAWEKEIVEMLAKK